MATYGKHYGYTKVRRRKQKYSILERVIDFSKKPVTSGDTVTTAWAKGDVLEVIGVRAGQTVLHVGCDILKKDALTTRTNILIGDGDNPSRWGAIDISTKGNTQERDNNVDQLGVDYYGAPKYYETKDTIDITIGGTVTTGRVKIIAHILEDDR